MTPAVPDAELSRGNRLAYLRCANPEQPIELVGVIDGETYVIPQEDRQVFALSVGGLTYLSQRRGWLRDVDSNHD